MDDEKKTAVRGLEGVIAGETRVGWVDGVNGRLYYAGYNLDDIAGKVCYEEVVFLLFNDRLPTAKELKDFRAALIAEMTLPEPLITWLKRAPREVHPMVVLRSAVSDLAMYDLEAEDNSAEANRRKAMRLVAQVSLIIAAMHRLGQKKELLPADPKMGLAANFLRAFTGREITKDEAEAIELMYVLHAEHDYNASTFSARVTASTMADLYAAITAAIATLKGPLHGGANQRVMEMLSDIGKPEDVDDYIKGMLARKEKIMGFGHREYKVEDPRAKFLRKTAAKLCARAGECAFVEMSALIEKKVVKQKGINPNVDFYSATVQHAMGIPAKYYTTLFAASRVAGWCAHVLEQHADNRLIRPRSQFTGQWPREFAPISKRK